MMALLSTLIVLVSAGGWAVLTYTNGQIGSVDLDLGDDRPEGAAGTTNFLLVGSDSRQDTGDRYGVVEGQRSDTILLAHLGADNTVTLLSFPRDTYVTIPEYTDADGRIHPPRKNKFNYAFSAGGAPLLVQLVQELVGMPIDHYIEVDINGFKDITDAIGGVEVCILPSDQSQYVSENGQYSSNTKDPMSGFVGGPGQVTLDGEMALAFVRQRYGLPNPSPDLDRAARQQQFLGAVLRRITQGGVLSNPVQLERLLGAVTGALVFDDNTDVLDLRGLATRLGGLGSGAMRSVTLPTHTPTRAEDAINDQGHIMIGGEAAAVQVYDPRDWEAVVAPLGGRVAQAHTDEAGASGPTAVQVVNGTTIGGLAERVTKELTAAGVPATVAGNTTTRDYVTTRILHGPEQAEAARALAARLPGAKLSEDADVEGVRLIAGSSYDGLTEPAPESEPAAGGQPAEAPAPAPQAQPPVPDCTY